jgi:hypothetical protein
MKPSARILAHTPGAHHKLVVNNEVNKPIRGGINEIH